MSKFYGGHAIKIEAGQILNPDTFPVPNELVCVQVPKIFDQVALRDCITKNVVLSPTWGICRPAFNFEGINNFDIIEAKIMSKTDSLNKPGFKKLEILVKISYDIVFTDGIHQLTQPDEAVFNLTVNEIYCPDCLVQTGFSGHPKDNICTLAHKNANFDIKVEALFETFEDIICSCTGALIFDIGAFFIISCECIVQLLIPSYGYCPVPAEQSNPIEQNCSDFNDVSKNTFPIQFFTNQKKNVLDNAV